MFNKTKISANLFGLVGFENPANPDYDVVDSANQKSRSGRYYTDNSYAKIEWFIDNTDYDQATDENVNDDLEKLSTQAITHVCDKVFDKPDFIDRQLLFQHANNKVNTDTLPVNNFVGYKIQTSLEKNQAFKFTRILLEFEGTGDLDLYLFHSSTSGPIESQTIEITSNNQAYALNWVIDYADQAFFKGEFYLGYLADEAIAAGLTPIKRDYNSSNVMSCITHMNFETIQVPGVTTTTLWDLDDEEGAEECWGINPDITVYDDYTDLITQNEHLFAYAIQLQGQINFLSKIIASRRSNIEQRMGKEIITRILTEIEGVVDTNKQGLKKELLNEINSLRKEVKKLSDGYFVNDFILNTMT